MKHDKTTDPGFALFQSATGEALDHLSRSSGVDTHVHTARKAIKRARAGLRLMRPALESGVFGRENRTLRDAGACLSPFRDAKARFDATALLGGRRRRIESMPAGLFKLRQLLKDRLATARKTLAGSDIRQQSAQLLAQSRGRLENSRGPARRKMSVRALRKIYKKARETLATATEATTPANLHELRKQCKYLHVAAEALRAAGVRRLGRVIARSHEVVDWLGDDHDLFALTAEIRRSRLDDHEASALFEAVANVREDLQRKALDCAGLLLRKSPRRFAARLA